jgi:hypothetical protein
MDIPSWSYLAVGQRLLSVNSQMEPLFSAEETTNSNRNYIQPSHMDKPESTSYITLTDFIPESNGILNWIVNHFT